MRLCQFFKKLQPLHSAAVYYCDLCDDLVVPVPALSVRYCEAEGANCPAIQAVATMRQRDGSENARLTRDEFIALPWRRRG